MSAVVKLERQGRAALITPNRPQACNAINAELGIGVCDAVAEAQDAGCIVITGEDQALCAGLDLKNLRTDKLAELPSYSNTRAGSTVPSSATVNGSAVTGGF